MKSERVYVTVRGRENYISQVPSHFRPRRIFDRSRCYIKLLERTYIYIFIYSSARTRKKQQSTNHAVKPIAAIIGSAG